MSREGAREQENNAWSADGGNPPNHDVNLVFTRFLSGPFDFTPGVIQCKRHAGDHYSSIS
jgi:alpha-glucosidase